MTTPNVNPSPKQRFLAIKTCVDQHRELVQRPDLQLALDYAQAQMVWETMGPQGSPDVAGNDAAARYFRLRGMHDFIRAFKTLAETPVAPTHSDAGEISHSFK